MARKKSSDAGAIVQGLALLPWWLCIGLAVLGFLVCRHYAMALSAQPASPMPTAATVFGAFAKVGEWLVPLLCMAAAALSLFGKWRRQALLQHARSAPANATLDGLTWQQFEQLVGAAYREQGYTVTETGGGGPDGGVDLQLTKGRERFLVQCKHWRAQTVGVAIVRELYGVMTARGATGGLVITSGKFSADARAFAEGRNIELINGGALTALIRQGEAVSSPGKTAPIPASKAPPNEMSCPRCGSPMMLRRSAKGSKIGEQFWGCSTFPACRGTRPA